MEKDIVFKISVSGSDQPIRELGRIQQSIDSSFKSTKQFQQRLSKDIFLIKNVLATTARAFKELKYSIPTGYFKQLNTEAEKTGGFMDGIFDKISKFNTLSSFVKNISSALQSLGIKGDSVAKTFAKLLKYTKDPRVLIGGVIAATAAYGLFGKGLGGISKQEKELMEDREKMRVLLDNLGDEEEQSTDQLVAKQEQIKKSIKLNNELIESIKAKIELSKAPPPEIEYEVPSPAQQIADDIDVIKEKMGEMPELNFNTVLGVEEIKMNNAVMQSELEQTQAIVAKYNGALQVVNNEITGRSMNAYQQLQTQISELTDKAMSELIEGSDNAVVTLEKLRVKIGELEAAEKEIQNTLEANRINDSISELEARYELESSLVNDNFKNEMEKQLVLFDLQIERYTEELNLKKELALLDNKITDEEKQNIQAVIDKLNELSIARQQASASNNDEKPKKPGDGFTNQDFLEKIGLGEEGQARFENAVEFIGNGLDTIDSIFEVNKQRNLGRINEEEERRITAINNTTLSEEEKATKIEAIRANADKKREQVEKKARKKQKKIAIIQAIINGAVAAIQSIANTALPFPASLAGPIAVAAATAAQIATISKQKLAKGGIIPFNEGGLISGPSHAGGGVSFNAGGQMMEAEGGEVVISKGIQQHPQLLRQVSDINAMVGGKRFFAKGGIVPSVSAPPAFSNIINQPQFPVEELRGVIADEVGSIQVINNVVDTGNQQAQVYNQQVNGEF